MKIKYDKTGTRKVSKKMTILKQIKIARNQIQDNYNKRNKDIVESKV
jgi:hypothetical protein